MKQDQQSPYTTLAQIRAYLLGLQNEICEMMEAEDGQAKFYHDPWQHEGGGGGITRVMQAGKVFEKAGVNFSHVHGQQLPVSATNKRENLANTGFQAMGVSVVAHPQNPFVPTAHFNVRFILVEKDGELKHWWFGGGFDLTPYYGFVEDCVHFHKMAAAACQPFGETVYQQFKERADQYFYLPHRKEQRGIGGIFFDDLHDWGMEQCFAFMRSVGAHFIKAYHPIVARRKAQAFTELERQFQLMRRGRYVEFNLLYDRGTLFGLQSGGRTDSILMSLPPATGWPYPALTEFGAEEAKLSEYFLQPRDWSALT